MKGKRDKYRILNFPMTEKDMTFQIQRSYMCFMTLKKDCTQKYCGEILKHQNSLSKDKERELRVSRERKSISGIHNKATYLDLPCSSVLLDAKPTSSRFLEKIRLNSITKSFGQKKDIFIFCRMWIFYIYNSNLKELLKHTCQ